MKNPLAEIADKDLMETGSLAQLMAYLMHQADLNSKMVELLVADVEASGVILGTQTASLLTELQKVTAVSSVDFGNLTATTEANKLPGLVDKKSKVNTIMDAYIKAVLAEMSK